MKVRPVTDAESVRKRILFLIDKCQSFMWATAWATEKKVIRAAIASEKMTCFVIGTHQYITSPDVIDMCLGVSEVKVMYPNGKKMFHPKIYAFDLGGSIDIYVGSSNLTNGGLSRNIECGVFLHAEKASPSLKKFMEHIEDLWDGAEDLNEDFAASYRANYDRMRDAKAELEEFDFVKKPKRSMGSVRSIDSMMSWEEFVSKVSKEKKYGPSRRLKVLSKAREFFARGVPFSKLTELERRCIAGVMLPTRQFDADWGLFGQMTAWGKYGKKVDEYPHLFSRALDHIPLMGPIKRRHYDAYIDAFKKIPGSSKTWIGMGTRLLNMKRPDYFVCYDGANDVGLSNQFAFAPTTTNLDNYWDRIITPMMLTPWWQADLPPDSIEHQIWMCRAAMLDAIHYKPKKKS